MWSIDLHLQVSGSSSFIQAWNWLGHTFTFQVKVNYCRGVRYVACVQRKYLTYPRRSYPLPATLLAVTERSKGKSERTYPCYPVLSLDKSGRRPLDLNVTYRREAKFVIAFPGYAPGRVGLQLHSFYLVPRNSIKRLSTYSKTGTFPPPNQLTVELLPI